MKVHASFQEANDYHAEKHSAKTLLDKTYGNVRIKHLTHQKGSLVAVNFAVSGQKGQFKRGIEWRGGTLILLPEVVNV